MRDAMRLGYGRGILAHSRWHRPFQGVRSQTVRSTSLYDRALHYLPRLRSGERFSHATALALIGCPIRVPRDAPVDVSSPKELGRVECRGVRGHRHSADSVEYLCAVPEHCERIPVVQPLVAVQQAAGVLPFPELVIALDHLLGRSSKRFDPYTLLEPEMLERFRTDASGRGAVRFREAAELARTGAESRMETLMRLGGVRAGMPELQLQLELTDAEGRFIGRFDGADTETRTLLEYDGEQHLTSPTQRRRDPRKHQSARDADWRILVFYHEDFDGGLLPVGRRMLDFSGRAERAIRPALARLLDEFSGPLTESAHPLAKRREAVS